MVRRSAGARERQRWRRLGAEVLRTVGVHRQPFHLTARHDLDALEQQLQSRAVHLAVHQTVPAADESASLQPLGPHAPTAAVEVQHLDLRASPIDEGEQRTVQRVLLQPVARQRAQAVVGLPHVHRLAIQPDADVSVGEEHQPRATRSVTPPPRSSVISSRCALGATGRLSAPSSTKLARKCWGTCWPAVLAERSAAPPSNRDLQRWKLLLATPSRWQNASTISPPARNCPSNSRHLASPRCRRPCRCSTSSALPSLSMQAFWEAAAREERTLPAYRYRCTTSMIAPSWPYLIGKLPQQAHTMSHPARSLSGEPTWRSTDELQSDPVPARAVAA
ncbi:hypothetical protein ROSA5918_25545 [Roseateles saccharophilus]|uniref:Uncharacterized protein n=1 Tax=Roseateles saccharophilus TaxID=304 RepID=A0A4R3UAR9_ROSSA|nr:hypothetical protein EV671_105321 [Roseateles saccharophilus]